MLVHAGQIYPLFGPKELTQFEIAQILSDVLGRKITYVPMEIEAFKGVLKNMGYTLTLPKDTPGRRLGDSRSGAMATRRRSSTSRFSHTRALAFPKFSDQKGSKLLSDLHLYFDALDSVFMLLTKYHSQFGK